MLTATRKATTTAEHRRHHIGREIPVDGRIDAGEEEAHQREADQLTEGFLTDV